MQNKYSKLKVIILSIFLTWQAVMASSTFEDRQNSFLEVEKGIELRWEKVKEAKKVFARYEKKSAEEIIKEYKELNKFRNQLWFSNPEDRLSPANPDYIKATITNKVPSRSRFVAFDYNCLDKFYNASTIFIYGHHFIALREPYPTSLDEFFRVLMNQEVSVLVRLNPEEEYFKRHNFYYWKEYIVKELNYSSIQPKVMEEEGVKVGLPIPYFYTDEWQDHKSVSVSELYRLVQEVRGAYEKIQNPGPIACHCKAGVGRTGTFIAAYVLANLLDILDPSEISIEAIVLKLSIQRTTMVGWDKQYLSLYEFCDYYLAKKAEANQCLAH